MADRFMLLGRGGQAGDVLPEVEDESPLRWRLYRDHLWPGCGVMGSIVLRS